MSQDTKINDGGPAFPSYHDHQKFDEDLGRYVDVVLPTGGMSLRDYFAAKAMLKAIDHELAMRGSQIAPGEFRYDAVAHAAYVMADAMLKEREK